MKNNEDIVFGLGCSPSKIDGTEHIVEADSKIPLPESYDWRKVMPPVRNQGNATTCVCQSLTGVLDFFTNARNGVANVCNNYSIDELYAQRERKNLNGMTFKEALNYLKHHGLSGERINGYGKVNSIEAAKYAIVMFGPIVCGMPVYNFSPKFWEKRGSNKGGHAVTLVGYDKDGFIIRNSWGDKWADGGYTKISYNEYNNNCFECWTVMP